MRSEYLTNTALAAILTVALWGNGLMAEIAMADDIVIADFEGDNYGDWKVEGEAFGKRPAQANARPPNNKVTGHQGKGLVNTFLNGDKPTGKLTSPPFAIERKFINFYIGAGAHEDRTCMNLLVDSQLVRSSTGPATKDDRAQEILVATSWDVMKLAGKQAVIEIVDNHSGGWGHIDVDHIVQSDEALSKPARIVRVEVSKTLTVDATHLLVPATNARGKDAPSTRLLLGVFDGEELVQSFHINLPHEGTEHRMLAYPIDPYGLRGKEITIRPADDKRVDENLKPAFEMIRCGNDSPEQKATDYDKPYRNQFHPAARYGWNNDPNGMVYHNGKYHLYFQHNPFGISWGNMHWGHFESDDMVHWRELPIALYSKTPRDAAFSGGGFVDFNNSAGLGRNTLFVAFTSTGRGECLAYSKDGGVSFTEIEENPVVTHKGRDPKVIWYAPEKKWVMAVYDTSPCTETDATTPTADEGAKKFVNANVAFYESKNLRQWTRTGAFTDGDRKACHECPELFEIPVEGEKNESRWIYYGAQNRYFVGDFNGKTFVKESGPHGSTHGAFYAAQTFSDMPDGRRVQVGWIRTAMFTGRFPNQMVNQALTIAHELTLRRTDEGLRLAYWPVKKVESLRESALFKGKDLTLEQVTEALQVCHGELTEVLIELDQPATCKAMINGVDADFEGRDARIFVDRTVTETYADGGLFYEVRPRRSNDIDLTETRIESEQTPKVMSLKVYRLNSIWPQAE